MASSREPLRVDGEAIWRVSPLTLPRLAEFVASAAKRQAIRVLVGRALPEQATSPLRPLAEALLELTRDRPPPLDDAFASFVPVLATLLPHWRSRDWRAPEEPLLVMAEAVFQALRRLSATIGALVKCQGRIAQPWLSQSRAWAIALNEPWFHRAWEGLADAVRTGEAAFDKVHGIGFWAYGAAHPDAGALFDAGMTSGSTALARALIEACDMTGVKTVVDVGGGQGRLLAELLLGLPHLRGILFDQPQVVAGAEPVLRKAEVLDRCQIVGGSVTEEVPRGGDAYILSRILHDWDDAEAAVILRGCQRAMAPNARLLLIDQVVPPGNEYAWSKLSDLNMLILFGGRERTEAEFQQLLDSTGFRLSAVHPTATSWAVVEAVRV